MQDKVNEILEKMKDARTWKESGVTMDEVKDVLNNFVNGDKTDMNSDPTETRRLKSKIDRLTESNKQLMAENKKLKGAR